MYDFVLQVVQRGIYARTQNENLKRTLIHIAIYCGSRWTHIFSEYIFAGLPQNLKSRQISKFETQIFRQKSEVVNKLEVATQIICQRTSKSKLHIS